MRANCVETDTEIKEQILKNKFIGFGCEWITNILLKVVLIEPGEGALSFGEGGH